MVTSTVQIGGDGTNQNAHGLVCRSHDLHHIPLHANQEGILSRSTHRHDLDSKHCFVVRMIDLDDDNTNCYPPSSECFDDTATPDTRIDLALESSYSTLYLPLQGVPVDVGPYLVLDIRPLDRSPDHCEPPPGRLG